MPNLDQQTIRDFGEQWTRYTSNDGYYASSQMWADICGPLAGADDFVGKTVVDVGSGTGRIVAMLLASGAARVVAIEPSVAFEVLQENLRGYGNRVEFLNVTGERIPPGPFDRVVSIGVLHHIPQPEPVVQAAYHALKPGGKMLVWLYGHEGNQAYLRFVLPLRRITAKLPHWCLAVTAQALTVAADLYTLACRVLPLPLADYMVNVLGKCSRDKRVLTVYDQLNPAYAKYYREDEARALLGRHGFMDIRLHHRRGYSWTVIGTKPDDTK